MNFTTDTDRLMAVYAADARERRRRARDLRLARPTSPTPIDA